MRPLLAPAVCASLMMSTLCVPQAGAAPLLKPGVSTDDAHITLVGHRRHRRHHRHRHHGNGAAGLIGAIIAGTLIAAAIQEGRADERDLRRCDEDFPDFDYETGTYINRHGDERICPYLR